MIRIMTLGAVVLMLATGCDRNETPPADAQSTAPAPAQSVTPTPAPVAPAVADPVLATAGLRLNQAKEFIDTAKFDEADAKLKDLDAIKDKLSAENRSRLNSLQTVSRAGRRMFESLNRPTTKP